MNIIYFTTAQETTDFNEFAKLWKKPINPSGQILHNKFIRALSISNHVDVISIRPFSRRLTGMKSLPAKENISSQVHWHYLAIKPGNYRKFQSARFQSYSIIRKLPKNSIIISDTLNPYVMDLAKRTKQYFKMPLAGLLYEAPHLIPGTPKRYTKKVLKLSSNFDGFISLTEGLNELYNSNDRVCLLLDGIVLDKNPLPIKNTYGQYFFVSGALSEKHGLSNIVEATKQFKNKNIKLLLSGFVANETKFKQLLEENDHVTYLGYLTNEECINYEQNAIAAINAREFNETLDKYSMPSKVLEYLNSGTSVISVKNSRLKKVFTHEIIWAESNSVKDLTNALNKFVSMSKEDKLLMIKKGQKKVNKLYSIHSVSNSIDNFLFLLAK